MLCVRRLSICEAGCKLRVGEENAPIAHSQCATQRACGVHISLDWVVRWTARVPLACLAVRCSVFGCRADFPMIFASIHHGALYIDNWRSRLPNMEIWFMFNSHRWRFSVVPTALCDPHFDRLSWQIIARFPNIMTHKSCSAGQKYPFDYLNF